MILSCSNISKAFGTEEILKHVSFHVEDHEKAAIVGINGAGKSTLLKIIVGELADLPVRTDRKASYFPAAPDAGHCRIYQTERSAPD